MYVLFARSLLVRFKCHFLEVVMLIGLTSRFCAFIVMLLLRLLGLQINQQNLLFEYFAAVLHRTISNAQRDGLYCDGIPTLTGKCAVSTTCSALHDTLIDSTFICHYHNRQIMPDDQFSPNQDQTGWPQSRGPHSLAGNLVDAATVTADVVAVNLYLCCITFAPYELH